MLSSSKKNVETTTTTTTQCRCHCTATAPADADELVDDEETYLVSISKRLLLAVRKSTATSENTGNNTTASSNYHETIVRQEQNKLESLGNIVQSFGNLSENAKKAFWINIYNSYLQLGLIRRRRQQQQQQDQQQSSKSKISIYKQRNILIAQSYYFSLDDIEHGILRSCKWKFGYGYINDYSRYCCCSKHSQLIHQLACQNNNNSNQVDYRIHFALNCGAKSCPPIAFYDSTKIDTQLDKATKSFLSQETSVDDINKQVHVSKLMYWYYGDFGGREGIYAILQKYLNDDDNGNNIDNWNRMKTNHYKLVYKGFSWEQQLNNYTKDDDMMTVSDGSLHSTRL